MSLSIKTETKILTLPSGRYVRSCRVKFEANLYSLLSIPDMLNEENSLLYNKYYRNPTLLNKLDKK